MRIEPSDLQDLRPLVRVIVSSCWEEMRSEDETLADRIAYPEQEAAAQLGIATHVLRDARYRGEIVASKVGRSYCYTRSSLLAFLRRQEVD